MLEDDARSRCVIEEDDVLVVICTIEAALLEKVQREGASHGLCRTVPLGELLTLPIRGHCDEGG